MRSINIKINYKNIILEGYRGGVTFQEYKYDGTNGGPKLYAYEIEGYNSYYIANRKNCLYINKSTKELRKASKFL